jgi:hypothetical protein
MTMQDGLPTGGRSATIENEPRAEGRSDEG